MKNLAWILLAIIVMGILLFLSRSKDQVPHALIPYDSTAVVKDMQLGGDYGGEETFLSSNTNSNKREKSENFKGKTFPQCLEMVSHWEDGHILEMGDGQGGLTYMSFITNGHHHVLTFSRNVCETDEISKPKY